MKKYIYIDLQPFFGFRDSKLDSFQRVSEHLFESSMDYRAGYEIPLSDLYIDIEDAYKHVSSETGLTRADLNQYSDDIEDAVRSAVSDAQSSSYEHEWMKKWYSEVRECIDRTLSDVGIEYSGLYLADSSKKYKITQAMPENWSDTFEDTEVDALAIAVGRKQMIAWVKETYGDYHQYYYDNLTELNSLNHETLAEIIREYLVDQVVSVDIEHVDYYGSLEDYDDWMEFFKDYEEVSWQIKKDIATHTQKLKAQINHSVPMQYRKSSI